MNIIQNIYINALLADAAYVQLVDNKNKPLSIDGVRTNLTARLTQPQADYLLANFDILTQTLSPTGGFDAVVWKGKSGTDYAGQVYVSMRGTQGLQDIDDDLALSGRGVPYNQVRDMANWWMRATAKPGDVVKQIKVEISVKSKIAFNIAGFSDLIVNCVVGIGNIKGGEFMQINHAKSKAASQLFLKAAA
jgi:hypothetical protein